MSAVRRPWWRARDGREAELRIRKATPRDHADLARLRVIMLEYITGIRFTPGELRAIDEHFQAWDGEDPLCLVAEEEGRILGCVAVSFSRIFPGPKNPTGKKAEVHNFAVYEEHRGRGIGKALFSRVLKECRERGVGRVSLYASDMGIPIYESFGFRREAVLCPEMRLYYGDLVGLDLE